MFEVGKNYEFHMIEAGDDVTFWGQVEIYDHPLLKIADTHFSENSPFMPGQTVRGQIINVTSPNFVSATRKDI